MPSENLSHEELKIFVIESLKVTPKTQFANLMYDVERLAISKGRYKDNTTYYSSISGEHKMPQDDREKIIHIVWELILARILIPGIDDINNNLPFIQLTDFGKKQISEVLPSPYDPDNFLKSVKQMIPSIDSTTYFYISEALRCYHSNCYTASAVMIGAASENMILILSNKLINTFQNVDEKTSYKTKIDKKDSIAYKYSVIRQQLEKNMKLIPKDISDNLQLILDGVFDTIRNYRNESGHPTGKEMKREVAFVNIHIFREYAKRISDLCGFIDTDNPSFTLIA